MRINRTTLDVRSAQDILQPGNWYPAKFKQSACMMFAKAGRSSCKGFFCVSTGSGQGCLIFVNASSS